VASFSDDFDRPDSTDLGAGWVEVSGDWSVISGRASPGVSGGTVILRTAGAMASNDHYAQVTIAATTAVSQGVWCRGDTTLDNGYLLRNNGSSWALFKVVSGAFTSIGSYAAAAVAGDVVKVQAVGSTIKAFINGTERISVTDTAVTTGTYAGIRSEANTGLRFDNFSAADVVAGATLGIAAETSSAQTLTGAKTTTLTVAAEQDAAQALAGAKAAALTPAMEDAAAQALGGAKTAPLPVAGESDTAQPVTGEAGQTLGIAGAVEAAMPLVGVKTGALVPALEDDAAHPVTRLSTLVPSRERTYKIPAERRRLVVAAEHRTLKVRR
jgi:hypothetical protein